jgi:hypothetical protein
MSYILRNSLFLAAILIMAFYDLVFAEDSEKSILGYFRPGIEVNLLVYGSEVKNFGTYSIPSIDGAVGVGLFSRIGGLEYGYFTTGIYAKMEGLIEEGFVSKDLEIYGINIASVDFLDLSWKRFSVEIPLLFSFDLGRIKLIGGTLLDFYAFNEVRVEFNEKVPIEVGSAGKDFKNDNDTPYGDLYFVWGLDIDIVKHWGAGVKCLIWGTSLGEAEKGGLYDIMGIEPARFQTRISAYFVF